MNSDMTREVSSAATTVKRIDVLMESSP